MIQTDQYKIPFFHLYETIYNFRHSIMNILEQNKFLPLADRTDLIKQLASTTEQNPATDFVDNSERALRDTVEILQTCLTTLTTTIDQNEEKHSQLARKEAETKTDENQSLAIIQQKESIINDLSQRYQQATEVLTENQRKFQEELVYDIARCFQNRFLSYFSRENEKKIDNQQKLIQNYQQELIRLQGRLSTIGNQEIAQPHIMFTRLDAERNEQILKQAVDNGKMFESTLDVNLNRFKDNNIELYPFFLEHQRYNARLRQFTASTVQ